jgi:Predicted phosphotransferase related to Ser/Thr protein kinases
MEIDSLSPMAQLAARHLDAQVDKLAINKLTGDASTRAYYRAEAEGRSLIISLYGAPFDENECAADRLQKLEAINPSARLTFASDACAHIEATELFLDASLPVPQILATAGSDRMMLFEDVGDLRLQDWLASHSAAEVRDAYLNAIELIVRMQEATEKALRADSICARMSFDEAKLRWELGFFFANYFNRYLHIKLDPATASGVQEDFRALCSELASRPRVLTHRDYHARNLMMHDGRMFIIDHQDARMGPASYDLASLIYDPYTTLDSDIVQDLIEQFIEMKSQSSVPLVSVTSFRQELELMIVQRMLKAIGTYASQAAANNPTYIPYIEPARERAIVAMKKLGRFDATRGLLEQTRV